MRSFTIKYFWIPGNKGIERNELAGTKAKEAVSFRFITQETTRMFCLHISGIVGAKSSQLLLHLV